MFKTAEFFRICYENCDNLVNEINSDMANSARNFANIAIFNQQKKNMLFDRFFYFGENDIEVSPLTLFYLNFSVHTDTK